MCTSSRSLTRPARWFRQLYENPVSWIGIDTEYRFSHDQPVGLPNGDEWRDIHSIQPFCIAFAIVSEDQLLRFVVDLRSSRPSARVQEVLDLPVPFAAHHARSETLRFLVARPP